MRPIGRIFAAAAVGSMALGLAACTTSTDSSASSDAKPSESSGSAKVDTSGDMQDWEKLSRVMAPRPSTSSPRASSTASGRP